MTKQIKETYIHEIDGIEVGIKINYQKRKISLVDTENFKVKHWIFPPSGLEYMEGWVNVLNAMQVVISGARLKLKVYLDDEVAERVDKVCELQEAKEREFGDHLRCEETGRPINNERE